MLDFGLLPPEITSTRMYTGPGSGPTMVAASAWDSLAAELDSFARGYSSVTSALADEGWTGSASQAMAAAAEPYAQWAATTAGQAEQAASQARSAAAAFEAAHGAVVPPPVVAANRIRLAHLLATNLLGQNAARIAATEAAYDAMWVQDAHAMHGYATSASSATKLASFTAPPPTTNPAAAPAAPAAAGATQSALSQFLSTVPQLLSAAPNSGTPAGIPVSQSLLTSLSNFATLEGPVDTFLFTESRNVTTIGEFIVVFIKVFSDGALFAPAAGLTGATSPLATGMAAGSAAGSPSMVLAGAVESANANRAVLASVGEAIAVGPLSAPAAWADATPVASANVQWLSSGSSWDAAPKVHAAGSGPTAAMAPMAAAAAARKVRPPSVSAVLQVAPPRYTMPRPSAGG